MPDLPCRVAKLEEKLTAESNDSREFREEVRSSLREIAETVHNLQLQREKQVGFIAGVAAVIGGVVTVIGYFFNKFYE